MAKLPEIRIQPGWLLYYGESKFMYDRALAKEGREWPSPAALEKRSNDYSKAWQPYEQLILSGMTKLYSLDFKPNVIDVYIAPFFIPKSHPLIINVRQSPDQFIDILAHELFHVLLTDNKQGIDTRKIYTTLYGNVSLKTRNHVFVHAGLKAIYLNVLKQPKRLKRDKALSKSISEGYVEAWSIVEQEGYIELIQKFKEQYNA